MVPGGHSGRGFVVVGGLIVVAGVVLGSGNGGKYVGAAVLTLDGSCCGKRFGLNDLKNSLGTSSGFGNGRNVDTGILASPLGCRLNRF